jgi:hypothetical protein
MDKRAGADVRGEILAEILVNKRNHGAERLLVTLIETPNISFMSIGSLGFTAVPYLKILKKSWLAVTVWSSGLRDQG